MRWHVLAQVQQAAVSIQLVGGFPARHGAASMEHVAAASRLWASGKAMRPLDNVWGSNHVWSVIPCSAHQIALYRTATLIR
eukprot:350940-Chlamydomonas_euryale.AAC.7